MRTLSSVLAAAVLAGCSSAPRTPVDTQLLRELERTAATISDEQTLRALNEYLQRLPPGGGCTIPVC